MKFGLKIKNILFPALLATLVACSNLDCPLDNVVRMQCNFYESETGAAYTFADYLSVTPAGRDTILLNLETDMTSFLLPLKETEQRDTLLLYFTNDAGQSAVDTLYVDHTLQPHFESVDCPTSVFHTLTSVRVSSDVQSDFPLAIDSVAVVRTLVNYDDVENVRLFLRSTSDD